MLNNCNERSKIEKKLAVKKKKKLKKQEKKKKKKLKEKRKKPAKTEHNQNNDDIKKEEKEDSVTSEIVSNVIDKCGLEPMEMIAEHLNRLLKSLPNQGFRRDDDEMVLNIQKCITTADKNGKWDDIILNLTNALDKIRPFNVNILIDRYNEYLQACDGIDGKNIVLLLGSTGSGKSTTIHYLKGSTMKQDKKTKHISPINVTDASLQKIMTGPSVSQSVTSYIAPVAMTFNDDRDDDQDQDLENVYLCDTPGFADSRGIEIDVANSLTLINAMHRANKISIILVLSKEDTGARMNQFKNIADNLKNLFLHYTPSNDVEIEKKRKDTEEEQEDAMMAKLRDIQIIFTKFESCEEISQKFEQYCEECDDQKKRLQVTV